MFRLSIQKETLRRRFSSVRLVRIRYFLIIIFNQVRGWDGLREESTELWTRGLYFTCPYFREDVTSIRARIVKHAPAPRWDSQGFYRGAVTASNKKKRKRRERRTALTEYDTCTALLMGGKNRYRDLIKIYYVDLGELEGRPNNATLLSTDICSEYLMETLIPIGYKKIAITLQNNY